MNIMAVMIAGVSAKSQEVNVAATTSKKLIRAGSETYWSMSHRESRFIISITRFSAAGSASALIGGASSGASVGGTTVTRSPPMTASYAALMSANSARMPDSSWG